MKKENKIFKVDKTEDSIGFLLWQVTNLWQREIRKALEKYDLTHSQFVLLASILSLNKEMDIVTQIRLSNHTKIDPMTVSTVLRTLQKKGLVKRKEHASDTRAKTVDLSPNGEKTVQQVLKTVEQFDKSFFELLGSKSDSFKEKLQAILKKDME